MNMKNNAGNMKNNMEQNNTTKNTAKEILSKIETECIEPVSKWKFQLHDVVLWVSGAIAVLIGGLAISVIIFVLANGQWAMVSLVGRSHIGMLMSTLPFYWILSLVLFLLIAHYNIKHTKHGYRYSIYKVLVVVILLSVILGGLFYSVGIGHAADKAMAGKLPFYKKPALEKQQMLFYAPEDGVLTGFVTEHESIDLIRLRDIKNNDWEITNVDQRVLENEIMFPRGSKLILIGEKLGSSEFEACMIKPLRERGRNPRFGNGFVDLGEVERKLMHMRNIECGPRRSK